MALGRSNDGSQFGMFLQVFADGTVIDSEGVHRLRSSDLRPLVEAIQNGELARLRGHCGTPSNDFIEYVHIVVFERRMGRLQAHSFSYAGNPQGCDDAIRHLHAALENIQAKLSRQPARRRRRTPGGDRHAAGLWRARRLAWAPPPRLCHPGATLPERAPGRDPADASSTSLADRRST